LSLTAYLDKGASLGRDAPCLTLDGSSLSYGDVQDLSRAVASALARSGVRAGDKVAILSGNDARAFACVFGIARRGAVWCPINPRNTAAENRELLALWSTTTSRTRSCRPR
jgi:fatty-acyl-CoA synthase